MVKPFWPILLGNCDLLAIYLVYLRTICWQQTDCCSFPRTSGSDFKRMIWSRLTFSWNQSWYLLKNSPFCLVKPTTSDQKYIFTMFAAVFTERPNCLEAGLNFSISADTLPDHQPWSCKKAGFFSIDWLVVDNPVPVNATTGLSLLFTDSWCCLFAVFIQSLCRVLVFS